VLRLHERSPLWPAVGIALSLEPVGEPRASLKLTHIVTDVAKSLGQQALRKIGSLEHFRAVSSPTRSIAASLKHRRYWPFPTRQLGLRIVVTKEIGGGLETRIQRSPNFLGCHWPSIPAEMLGKRYLWAFRTFWVTFWVSIDRFWHLPPSPGGLKRRRDCRDQNTGRAIGLAGGQGRRVLVN
jgi:hypothetical protein